MASKLWRKNQDSSTTSTIPSLFETNKTTVHLARHLCKTCLRKYSRKKPFSHLLNDKIQMKHFLLTIHYLAHQDNVITPLRSLAGRRFAFNTTPTPPSAYRVLCSGLKYPIICSFFGLNAKLINRYQLQKYAEFTYFPYVEVESSTTRMMFFFQDLSAILTFYCVVRGEFV